MDLNNFVQFKKERDLSAIITDTFKFVRLEWKPFFTSIFKISIVPILLAVASAIFFAINFSDIFNYSLYYETSGNSGGNNLNFGMFILSALLFLLFYLIAYVMLTISALYYIKSYADNMGTIDFNYIKNATKTKFWPLFILFIISGILIVFGAFLCFFPGVYLGVVLSLASSMFVFHEKGVMETLNDIFDFIKGHWWETFGILLVITLMIGVMNYITQLPAMIYQLIKMGLMIENNDPTQLISLLKDPIYLILTIFSYIIKFFLYTISLITNVFVFFDINEQKNATGSIELIDTIGN